MREGEVQQEKREEEPPLICMQNVVSVQKVIT